MITVSEALDQLFALVSPLAVEQVDLRAAAGRILAREVMAQRTQPPFAASSMDGYALRRTEVEPDAMFKVIGEAAAGHAFDRFVGPGQAVRIFTGAPVPEGADFVVIQEDTTRRGDLVTLGHRIKDKDNIRPAGSDFAEGQPLAAPRRLSPSDIALLAAMNIAQVPVTRKPKVAIIATGDELVIPGETPGADQIIASNSFGLAAMIEALGATARLMPIAGDTPELLKTAFALSQGADLIVTIGGASVGDHDLVGPVAADLGMKQAFYKVAMRPGKPLMAGSLNGVPMIGLPGNPVSALVCGTVFLTPLIRAMQGLGTLPLQRNTAPLALPLPANGPREHYMRAIVQSGTIAPVASQDSAMLRLLADANALLIRPAHDAARAMGDVVEYLAI